jgi:NADH-quinone oxidoreductase subunit H
MAMVWRIALSGVLFVVAAMGAILYLGGWLGPLLPGPVWFLLKTYGLMGLMVWLGTRVQPMSTAKMLALAWRLLIPVGMVNVLVIGVEILLGVGPR